MLLIYYNYKISSITLFIFLPLLICYIQPLSNIGYGPSKQQRCDIHEDVGRRIFYKNQYSFLLSFYNRSFVSTMTDNGVMQQPESRNQPPGQHFPSYNAAMFDKLNGVANYSCWKFNMKNILILENLWECVVNTVNDPIRDQRALARICLAIQPSCYQYVRNALSAKEAWQNLAKIFEDRGLYRRVVLLRQLHRAEYSHYKCMNDYITSIMNIVQQLADMDKVIDDGEVAEILLSGLSQEFDVLVSSLETACLTNNLTSELVRTRLLQEDYRRNGNNENGNLEPNGLAYLARKKIVCDYCHKIGHIATKCYKKRRETKKKEEHTLYASALLVAHKASDFIIDSGASTHMCCSSNLVTNFKSKQCHITIANGEQISAEGVGTLPLLSDSKCNVNLTDVLVVPNLSANLLSVSKMADRGYTILFDMDGCRIFKKCKVFGDHVLSTKSVNGLYTIQQSVPFIKPGHSVPLHTHRQGSVSANAASVPASLWHKRLGHISLKGMNVLGGGSMSSGVVFQKDSGPEKCIPCLTGKMQAKSFPRTEGRRATTPLELVHSDVWGPAPVCSWGGARYLLTFTDDCTRKTFGFLMKNKTEVSSHFINFKKFVEKQTGLPIKILRTDNGTEYCNTFLSSFLKTEGIIHQTTVPYTPQQNGVAERLNWTIFEKARCMLQD